MTCPACKKEIKYSKETPYNEMWASNHIDGLVMIYCHNEGCMEVLKNEKPNPSRYVIKFGKNKGKRLSEIKDQSHLDWLLQSATKIPEEGEYDGRDKLLEECIKQLL